MPRLAQVMWLLDHLDDVESDLSAFHRIDDMGEMDSTRFFRFAFRLPAYGGVMQARAMAEERGSSGQPGTAREPEVVLAGSTSDLERMALLAPDLVEVSRAGG